MKGRGSRPRVDDRLRDEKRRRRGGEFRGSRSFEDKRGRALALALVIALVIALACTKFLVLARKGGKLNVEV